MLRYFFVAFSRPMYVQEYRRLLSSEKSPLPDVDFFLREHAMHTQLINVVKGVHERYTGHNPSEYDIVDEWLHLFGRTAEETNTEVTSNVVQSDLYRTAMRAKIADTHRALFDGNATLTEYDLDCLFDVARGKELALAGDELRDCVSGFQKETDQIHNRICDIYVSVYDRDPDVSELEQNTRDYRERLKREHSPVVSGDEEKKEEGVGIPMETLLPELDAELERRLVSDLEFHDVIKRRIKQVKWDEFEEIPTPRGLFDILRTVLKTITDELPPDQQNLSNVNHIVERIARDRKP